MTTTRPPQRPHERLLPARVKHWRVALEALLPRPGEAKESRRLRVPAHQLAKWRAEAAGRTLDLDGWQDITAPAAPALCLGITVAELLREWQDAQTGVSGNMGWQQPYTGSALWLLNPAMRGTPHLILIDSKAAPGESSHYLAYVRDSRAYIRSPAGTIQAIDLRHAEAAAWQLGRFRWRTPPLPVQRRKWFRRRTSSQ